MWTIAVSLLEKLLRRYYDNTNPFIHGMLGSPVPDEVFSVWSALLIGSVVFKYGWNAKRFTDTAEQDIEAEVDSE